MLTTYIYKKLYFVADFINTRGQSRRYKDAQITKALKHFTHDKT